MVEMMRIPLAVEGYVFYDSVLGAALADCQKEHRALFMPEILDARSMSDEGSFIWENWFSSPSVRVTGTTKGGSKVVVYGHVPNYFSNPKNIEKAIKDGLKNGAGRYPQKGFETLLALEDGVNVFVVDYAKLSGSSSDVIPVSDALRHPQTIPFIGGEERAELYLKQHEKVVGSKIGILHSNDLHDVPYGRVLFCNNRGNGGSLGGNLFYNTGRFVGVPKSAAGGARKTVSPLAGLTGKGTDVGNGLVVLQRKDLTSGQYRLLVPK